MAETVKKAKATAKPLNEGAKKDKAAKAAKPATTSRKTNEPIAKVEKPKKTTLAAKPRKMNAKKDNVIEIARPALVSREMIEQLAYRFWAQRGYRHGHALEDWIRAEKELVERAS